MRQENIHIIPVQAAATITTAAIDSRNLFACSAQITATGSAAGTLIIQASDDDISNGPPVNFSPIPLATIAVSGAGTFLIPKTDLCYQWVRMVFTNSGTGTISVVFKALGE